MNTSNKILIGAASACLTMPALSGVNVGAKVAFQKYSNSSSAPQSLAAGAFVQIPLPFFETLSYEVSAQHLGVAKTDLYSGGFSLYGLTGRYTLPFSDNSAVYAGVGGAYWHGESELLIGGDKVKADGFSPLISLGYEYYLTPHLKGAIEYQYVRGLGDDTLGMTDSQMLSLGMSWFFGERSGYESSFLVSDDVESGASFEGVDTIDANDDFDGISSGAGVTGRHIESLCAAGEYGHYVKAENGIQYQHSFYFANDKSNADQEALTGMVSCLSTCKPQSILVEGFADAPGGRRYNMNLSIKRVDGIKSYINQHIGVEFIIKTKSYGEELSAQSPISNHLDRRVDITATVDCASQSVAALRKM